MGSNRCGLAAAVMMVGLASAPASAQPTLKGPIDGILREADPFGGFVFEGKGHLTLMGRVHAYGEMRFVPGAGPGSWDGAGVMVLLAANRDVLVARVLWRLDAAGNGRLEFRWPGAITLADGTTIASSGRFRELPFGGLRGTSQLLNQFRVEIDGAVRITMTGEIVDPDPQD